MYYNILICNICVEWVIVCIMCVYTQLITRTMLGNSVLEFIWTVNFHDMIMVYNTHC